MNNVGEIHLEKYFSENIFFAKHFQVDITSSDINEFCIGQKTLKAENEISSNLQYYADILISLEERAPQS